MFLRNLTWTKLHARIHFHRKHIFFKKYYIKQQNAKSVTDASIYIKFILKKIKCSLFNSPFIIPRYEFHFRSTDLEDKLHL